jgi:hypothetical protein
MNKNKVVLKENSSYDKILNFIKNKNFSSLSTWLEEAFKSNDFSPFLFNEDSSNAAQLERLFSSFKPEQKEEFINAVNIAIKDSFENDPTHDVLGELIILAAYIKAYSVTDILLEILNDQTQESNIKSSHEDTIEKIICVLVGFAEDNKNISAKIEKLFDSLFYSDFNPAYSAQLFIGLCACSPENSDKYLMNFLIVYRDNSSLYVLDIIMKRFVRVISSSVLREKYNVLNAIMRSFLHFAISTKMSSEEIHRINIAINIIDEKSGTSHTNLTKEFDYKTEIHKFSLEKWFDLLRSANFAQKA